MAATTLKEVKGVVAGQSQFGKQNNHAEVKLGKCDCCGLVEECTPGYIARVREPFGGRWICGLCAEAVEEERHRSKSGLSAGLALKQHMEFCHQFMSSDPPTNPTENPISAMKHLLCRTLHSSRKKKGLMYPS